MSDSTFSNLGFFTLYIFLIKKVQEVKEKAKRINAKKPLFEERKGIRNLGLNFILLN